MKYLLFAMGLVGFLLSCSLEPLTSEEIAKRCQAHHEVEGRWYNKEVVFTTESENASRPNNPQQIELRIDNRSNTVEYHNLTRGVHVEYTPDSCIAHNDSSVCEDYTWTVGYYPYIWGMPAKFFDPGVKIEEAYEQTVVNDKPVYAIQIAYEKETYDFYINQETYYLEGFKFVKNEGGKGEIVYHTGSRNVNGMLMPTERIWYDLDMKLLGTDRLK